MRAALSGGALGLAAIAWISGCGRTETSARDAGAPAIVLATRAAELPRKEPDRAQPGQRVSIAGGKFTMGSLPGDTGRDPTTEPVAFEAALKPFTMDVLPYPNDPRMPPQTSTTREESARLCQARGARLCTEAEWEHACKGPAGDEHMTGATWDPSCESKPETCASGFGVRGMGVWREWTSSQMSNEMAVVRGGGHRCARRLAQRDNKAAQDMTFRCCTGENNAVPVTIPEAKHAFRRLNIAPAELGKIIGSIPQLGRLGADIRVFDPGHIKGIVERSHAKVSAVEMTVEPLLWTPEPGLELVVFTGRTKKDSFIVALYPLPGQRYRFASAFLMENEVSPIALAYEPRNRKELLWSACWGCAGEQGAVSLRDDHTVVVVQH